VNIPGEPAWHYWVTLLVQIAAMAVAIWVAYIAIHVEQIKKRKFKPKLELEIVDKKGAYTDIKTQMLVSVGGRLVQVSPESLPPELELPEPRKARYYHLYAKNTDTDHLATEAQVIIKEYKTKGPNDQYISRWKGKIPMKWQHQEKPDFRKLGADAICDLCVVKETDKDVFQLEILTAISPNNLKTVHTEACNIEIILVLQALEAASKEMKIRISWDGDWVDGSDEMAQKLIVEEVI
jgi:hypothetical protein